MDEDHWAHVNDDYPRPESAIKPAKAIVLVLGDIGHSPRMCYHASSLASRGIQVDLVGYAGSCPHQEILRNELIRRVHLPSPPKCLNHLPRIPQLLVKCIFLCFTLFWTLLFRTAFRVSVIFVQNPPGIPAMLICYVLSRLKSATFVVDWHNYSYTMLRQSFAPSHGSSTLSGTKQFLVDVACRIEGFSGRCADHNICVSNTMRQDLQNRWGIKAITLYDKPPRWNFTSMNAEDRHHFLRRLFASSSFPTFSHPMDSLPGDPESTLFTIVDEEWDIQFRDDRPLFLVSSTSWTEDEDFGILLDALKDYDKDAELRNAGMGKAVLPKLFVVITGKGPQKEHYVKRIGQMRMSHVTIVTAWLAAEDYPRLLASADLGVSLHTSTSGLDLPMKIVDMFGCGLPVLAKSFRAIEEQVTEGVNGRIFDNSTQLRQILVELATQFPNNRALDDLKHRASVGEQTNWHEQWYALLFPIIDPILEHNRLEQSRWERFN